VTLVRTPVELSETPAEIRQPAARVGADNDDILLELGFTADEIAAFAGNRVI
jgi:crotonobetainyl-CoA:carnitine CoA-transferase CaiB-like acyl-CoA transferase